MKTRRFLASLVLAVSLSLSAFAGDMINPGYVPPPPPPPDGAISSNEGDTGLTDAMLSILQSILAWF